MNPADVKTDSSLDKMIKHSSDSQKNSQHEHFMYLPMNGRLCVAETSHAHKYLEKSHRHFIHGGCFGGRSTLPLPKEDNSKSILLLQRKLKEIGFYQGNIDGKDSPAFRIALDKVPDETWRVLWRQGSL